MQHRLGVGPVVILLLSQGVHAAPCPPSSSSAWTCNSGKRKQGCYPVTSNYRTANQIFKHSTIVSLKNVGPSDELGMYVGVVECIRCMSDICCIKENDTWVEQSTWPPPCSAS